MNCKPGDMAVVIAAADTKLLINRFVIVERAYNIGESVRGFIVTDSFEPAWIAIKLCGVERLAQSKLQRMTNTNRKSPHDPKASGQTHATATGVAGVKACEEVWIHCYVAALCSGVLFRDKLRPVTSPVSGPEVAASNSTSSGSFDGDTGVGLREGLR